MATGTASLDEVQEAVEAVRASGQTALMLMQCTAAYPAPLESLNVRAIVTMKRAFGVPVGLSDHSRDPLVGPLAAVSVGANLLEKHFTLSNDLSGPDHRFAIQPDELRLMIRKVRELEQALGTGEKAIHPIEAELRAFARRSIFAVKEIPAGTVMTHENVAILRCGKLPGGFPPKAFPDLLGRKVVRPIPAGTAIQPGDVT
jgi:sialic acid synthase SpsE